MWAPLCIHFLCLFALSASPTSSLRSSLCPCFTLSPCLCPRWQVGNNFTSPLPKRSYYPCYIYRLLFLMKVLCHVHGNFKRAEPMKNLRIIINQADPRKFIASHVGSLFVCDDFRIGSQESKTFIHNSRKYPFVPTSNQRFEKKICTLIDL